MQYYKPEGTAIPVFHWRFWKPICAIGGRVWFGLYYECDHATGGKTLQTAHQYRLKRDMGIFP